MSIKNLKLQNPFPQANLKRYPEGHITQFFGENKELYLKAIGMPGHPGIDVYQPYGTPILAPYDGKITGVFFQEDNKIGGNQIDLFSEIQPDGLIYETIYAHCSKIIVQKGQQVKAGEKIGEVGNSGFVISGGIQYWQNSNPDNKGTHLHFGLRISKPLRPGDMESLVIQNWDNGFHGWIDPLPFLTNSLININKNMKYIILPDKNQYLLCEEYKLAFAIADEIELKLLFGRGLVGIPELIGNLDGYIIYPLVNQNRLRDIFNL